MEVLINYEQVPLNYLYKSKMKRKAKFNPIKKMINIQMKLKTRYKDSEERMSN